MGAPIKVDKTVRMSEFEIVKFQLLTHCFIAEIHLNETELNILTLFGCSGEVRLIDFCRNAAEKGYLSNYTAVNNCLSRIEKSKLFLKKGAGKKLIYLNPSIEIYSKGTIVLNYKFIKIES